MVGLGSLLLLIYIFKQADSHPALRTALQLGSALKPSVRHQKPLVVLIDPYKHYAELLNQIKYDKDEREESEEEDDPKEDAKSVFYSYLRTSPEEELDPEVENHKNFLRSALRARCQKVSSCRRKCPPKKPACPINCKEVFDSLNVCDPPKKKKKKKTYKVTYEFDCEESDECGGKKYGKTMPPRWRMKY